jgi:octaprenyl-diphosphate synthase
MLGVHTSGRAVPEAVELPSAAALSWKHVIGTVDPFLKAVLQRLGDQIQEFDPDIAAYAQYALTGQGKQLRPALVALSAEATGRLNDEHVLVAVIIEMVHLATLVHDDVMDEASIRRGRPTLAANWGNEISVLLGDCLFAHAVKLAASFPTPEICRAVASATNTVCAGEILQTQLRRNFELSRAEYFKVVSMKTGELFALSCDLGAFLSGSTDRQRTALRQYGMAIGTAYQIYDDCLDLFGSEADAGKSLGTDLAKGKLTLPMLYLLENVETGKREKVRQMVVDWEPESLPQVVELLRQHGALEFSCEAIAQYLDSAHQSLTPLAACSGRSGLLGLGGYLAQQTDALRSLNLQ